MKSIKTTKSTPVLTLSLISLICTEYTAFSAGKGPLDANTKNVASTSITKTAIDPFKIATPKLSAAEMNVAFSNFPVLKDVPLAQNYNLTIDPISAANCRAAFSNKYLSLDQKIRNCMWLADQIIWEQPMRLPGLTLPAEGAPQFAERTRYIEWSPKKQNRLLDIYRQIETGQPTLDINCPTAPQNMVFNGTVEWPQTAVYTLDQAFDIFAAHVAHVLYLEIQQKVPWSILNRPKAELTVFFDSNRMFTRPVGHYLNGILRSSLEQSYPRITLWHPRAPGPNDYYNTLFASSTRTSSAAAFEDVCDPRVGYRFLTGLASSTRRNMVGRNELETLKNITWWFYTNVSHGSPQDVRNATTGEFYAKLNQRLRRRTFVGYPTSPPRVILPVGCKSGKNLFFDLARSINIPLMPMHETLESESPNSRRGIHGGLIYGWGGRRSDIRVLFHPDELYAMYESGYGFYPVNDRGQPATELEKQQLFFDKNWPSLPTLEGYGFIYNPHNGLMDRNATLKSPYTGIADFADDGYYGGYFIYVNNQQRYAGLFGSDKAIQLCSYGQFLQIYCQWRPDLWVDNIDAMPEQFKAELLTELRRISTAVSSAPSSMVTPEGAYRQARACINAYGGCLSLRSFARSYNVNSLDANYFTE